MIKDDKVYNIYYCSDKNGLPLLIQSIESIGKNCTSYYRIHCLITSLDKNEIYIFKNKFTSYLNIDVIVYDCSELFKGKFEEYDNVALYKHISRTTMLRIYVDEVIDLSHIDKLLYLDNDTYINKDLKELFDIDISNYYIGAVRDVFINWSKNFEYRREEFYIDKIQKHTYFNGGVELLNIRKLLENDMFKKLKTFQLKPYMLLTDQDIYNVVFEGGVKYLDLKYNCKWWMNFNKDDMTIIHAAGNPKQLNYLQLLAFGYHKSNKKYKTFDVYNELNDKANLKMLETNDDKPYNIYYCTDSNKVELMIMSINSLIENSNNDSKYIVHCLTYNLDDNIINRINSLYSDNVTIKHYDCTNILNELCVYSNYRNSNSTISTITMLRMYIDKIIDLTDIDKILYLDTDTYINKDLKYLFNTDLTGYYIGAVRDLLLLWSGAWEGHDYYKKYQENQNYFNGGVELLNIQEMMKDNKFYELQMTTFDNKEYELADQDIYNEVLGDKVKYLDLYYNYKWWLKEWNYNYIYILHFAGCKRKQQIFMNFLSKGFKKIPHECNWELNSFDFDYYYQKNFELEDM